MESNGYWIIFESNKEAIDFVTASLGREVGEMVAEFLGEEQEDSSHPSNADDKEVTND